VDVKEGGRIGFYFCTSSGVEGLPGRMIVALCVLSMMLSVCATAQAMYIAEQLLFRGRQPQNPSLARLKSSESGRANRLAWSKEDLKSRWETMTQRRSSSSLARHCQIIYCLA